MYLSFKVTKCNKPYMCACMHARARARVCVCMCVYTRGRRRDTITSPVAFGH